MPERGGDYSPKGELQVAFFAKLTSFVKLKDGFLSNPGSHPNSIPPFKRAPFGSSFKWRSGGRDGVHKFFSKIYSLAILKIFVNSLSLINKNY